MSIGPTSAVAGSAAGSPLSQTSGAEVDRAGQDAAAFQRRVHANEKAAQAAGVGQTDGEDHETEERDADGRRLWEEPPEATKESTEDNDDAARQSKDASGQRGNLLDLSG